jgi:peptide chain release factor 1
MFDKLKSVEARFDEINEKLMDPNVVSDQANYTSLMKELKNLTPVVEKYREHEKARESFDEAKALLDEGGMDKDFKEMAEEQLQESKEQMETAAEELKILLLPKDPDDEKSVIIEIRGGAGGDEAALFANTLYRMYSMHAETKRWKVEILNANQT